MDKTTKWLRLQVPVPLYDELVQCAKEDDRDLPTFLRRHLERMFPLISLEKTDLVYHGMETRTDRPAKDFQIQTGVPKVFPAEQIIDRNTGCDCRPGDIMSREKCRRKGKGLTGQSVHGLPRDPDSHCPISTDAL